MLEGSMILVSPWLHSSTSFAGLLIMSAKANDILDGLAGLFIMSAGDNEALDGLAGQIQLISWLLIVETVFLSFGNNRQISTKSHDSFHGPKHEGTSHVPEDGNHWIAVVGSCNHLFPFLVSDCNLLCWCYRWAWKRNEEVKFGAYIGCINLVT